ncbi:uncharacterized protein LOC112509123 [Cynara cardunculus var. scolymus]|uniref:uncharacterized protein LOC112509123 n=1 Tax=Cynara cardunculus var. scolymus TaxID=59895 RepID=UPI000D62D80F|nr:uncharacterized protein LOC112509123 [Cynara cardunculus var. scolymus]
MAGDKIQPPIIQPLHPATTVTNIKNQIPITLTTDGNTYNSWVALFKVQCTVCRVLDHILPDATAPSEHDDEWKRIDAIVLQWLYGTIPTDLLTTILKVDNTVAKAWSALERLFLDSKPTRALHLQQKFYNTKQASFTSATAYCQELKHISDQLSNVNAQVTDQTLVLQLISGLSPEYDNFATTLQQADKFPSFETARSKLVLEEDSKAKRLADAPAALHTTCPYPTTPQHRPPAGLPRAFLVRLHQQTMPRPSIQLHQQI